MKNKNIRGLNMASDFFELKARDIEITVRRFIFHLFVIVTFIGTAYADLTREEAKLLEEVNQPRICQTGICSGRVVDAVSGKPIKDAVVVYTWDVREFFIKRDAEQFETTTDINGKYLIPSKNIVLKSKLSGIELEEVFIYKNGYLWYRVFGNQPYTFMECVPGLNQKYTKRNNIVKLQRWDERLSHREHIEVFDGIPYSLSPKLKEALKEERSIAKQEEKTKGYQNPNAYKVSDQLQNSRLAFEKGQITKEEYVRLCHENLKADNIPDLCFSAVELNKLGDPNGVESLIQFLKRSIYSVSFDSVLPEISRMTGREDLEQTNVISERLEIVKDLEGWWGRNKKKEKAEWISDLTVNGRNDKVKMEALNNLQHGMDKSAVPYLVKLLTEDSKNAEMYENALHLLSKQGDKSVIPAVKSKLYHPDIYVRRQAAITLNTLGDRSGIPIMIASLESRNKNSRSVANAALEEMTGQDFAGGQSLRRLSDIDEKAVLNKWKGWWRKNRDTIGAYKEGDISKAMASEETAMKMRYVAMEEEEKNNPELPMFENSAKTPKVTFEQFKSAILKNDIKMALSLMDYPLKEKYEKVFKQMGEHRRDYAKGLGNIYFDMKLGNELYYEMVTEQDEGLIAYPVNFVQDENGDWLITEL
jgi:hypothetical protein